MTPRYWLAFATILGFAGSTPGEAATIVSPASAVTSTIPTAGGTLGQLIDQSGLSENFISGVTDFDTYIALGPTSAFVSPTNGWASQANKLPGFLEFDMGADYAISGFALWNQNNILGVDNFTLTLASDSGFTTNVTNLGTFNAAESLAAQTFTVSGTGEFVRLEINTTHGATQANLGEIAFDATLIPEPCSLAVLGLSCVGMGFARRRRA